MRQLRISRRRACAADPEPVAVAPVVGSVRARAVVAAAAETLAAIDAVLGG